MMKCSDELVQLYAEGSLEAAARSIVEEHLRTCTDCRRAAAWYKALFWDLGRSPGLAPESPIDPEELAALLQAEQQRTAAQPSAHGQHPALVWLTANPAVAKPVHAVERVSRTTLKGLARAGRAGLRALRKAKGGGRS